MNSETNLIGFDVGTGKELGRRLPPGFYVTVPEILKSITLKEHQNKIYLNFNSATKRVSINVQDRTRVILYDGLAQMLGFECMQISTSKENVDVTVESSHVVDPFAQYRVLFVYKDIVESQVVGDILDPLLGIVNVEGSDGQMVNAQYDRLHYLPVRRKIIDKIEIVIRTHTGYLAAFERGRSYVKLHFRQKHLA